MSDTSKFLLTAIICASLLLLAVILCADNNHMRESFQDRITILEGQMQRRIRPIIHINRASVYNSDGEVVVESHK